MATVGVRYIVDDVNGAIEFYTSRLGFREVMHPAPTFALVQHGDLRLALSAPSSQPGGGQVRDDGTAPSPGGWNRIQLEVEDLAARVATLRDAGVVLRGDIAEGFGGDQVIVDDPSGNPVELFQPKLAEAKLSANV